MGRGSQRHILYGAFLLILAGFLQACASKKPNYFVAKEARKAPAPKREGVRVRHVLYLIGDAGGAVEEVGGNSEALDQLKDYLEAERDSATVVFLGDNIYPEGMPPVGEAHREEAEVKLEKQISVVEQFDGRVIFLPGNHDWKKGQVGGWEQSKRQETYLKERLGKKVYLPSKGCAGPEDILVNDHLALIVYDSQWWLHPEEDRPENVDYCKTDDTTEFFYQMAEVLEKHGRRNRQLVVLAHHPLFTNGEHGGHFAIKDHIFPLSNFGKAGYFLPLPILGSFYPLYRTNFGNVQDLAHPKYDRLKEGLLPLFRDYSGLVYASGHDHSLQLISQRGFHQIVSGAGSKLTYAKKGGQATFVGRFRGFSRLVFYEDGSQIVEFIEGKTGQVIFSQMIRRPDPVTISDDLSVVDYSDSTVLVQGFDYEHSEIHEKVFGKHYREEWNTLVKVPVLDLGTEKGGLTPIKKGGGAVTKSLRVKDSTGQEYVLRSVQKILQVGPIIQNTVAGDLAQDQMSAIHPYGQLAVPPMAEALGLLHANPSLRFIPNDPRLGVFREEFKGMLVMIEERPNGDESSMPNFGNSKDLVSTREVVELMLHDSDNQVDEKEVLRARLFDMLLGDFDRHEDQWRWATYETDTGLFIRPIARDRDNVFFRFDGPVSYIIGRKWVQRRFKDFKGDIIQVADFNSRARHFDRFFLTRMQEEDWKEEVRFIQEHLTDELIDSSLKQLPPEVYGLSGENIAEILKQRRDGLLEPSLKYHRFLAKKVTVKGSEKSEVFELENQADGNLSVKMYRVNKEGTRKQLVYDRMFLAKETKEVHLYGMAGTDRFALDGEGKPKVKIRIIGGEGEDTLSNQLESGLLAKDPLLYEQGKTGTVIENPSKFRKRLSNNPRVHEFDRYAFNYDLVKPVLSFNYNVDDGFFVGGGFELEKQGFRRKPYAYRLRMTGNVALRTASFNYKMAFEVPNVAGRWSFLSLLDVRAPSFADNFFGIGNETVEDTDDRRFNLLNINDVLWEGLIYTKGINRRYFGFGPTVQYAKPIFKENRFVSSPEAGLTDEDFQGQFFVGLTSRFLKNFVDSQTFPHTGYRFNSQLTYLKSIERSEIGFLQMTGDVSLYFPVGKKRRNVIATRVGAGLNIGEFEFYQANELGGITNLRGFRKTRFSGKSSFYHNTEYRQHITNFRTYIFKGSFGVLGLFDYGRVWVPNDPSTEDGTSRLWHYGFGGGIWVSPLHVAVFTLTGSKSREDFVVNGTFGFFF